MQFASIPEALEALRTGQMVIVVDDEDRENEGDLIIAAEHISVEKMAFMIRYTGGVVCLSLSNAIADLLELPAMERRSANALMPSFTVSIEAAKGVTTGISAQDRVTTIRAAANPVAKASDLQSPGHVFPLRAQDGGVLWRAGHTEASVDLMKLAGLREASVISELMHEDGTMMRLPALKEFAKEQDILLITIEDLIAYRRKNEVFVRRQADSTLETDTGEWHMIVYEDALHSTEHVAMVKGEITAMDPTLVRVHSECLTGDAFGSLHCDCGDQLHHAMKRVEEEGKGIVLYMRQEGRGIGLTNKVKAYKLQQEEGLDTVQANEKLGLSPDLREYGIGAQILKDLGVGHLRLLTNNPKKVVGLDGYGLHLVEQVPIECSPRSEKQKKYMKTKKEKMGHVFKDI